MNDTKILSKLEINKVVTLTIEEQTLSDKSIVHNVCAYRKTSDGMRVFATNYESVTYDEAIQVVKKMKNVFESLEFEF